MMDVKDLKSLKAKDIMMPTSAYLTNWQTLSDALQIFVDMKVSALPVLDKFSRIIGAVTQQKIIEAMARKQDLSIKIGEILETKIKIVKETDLITDYLQEKNYLIVVTNKAWGIAGIITKEIISHFFLRQYKLRIKLLETVFESAHNGICAIDASGKITSFNPAAERMSGRKREEAIGKFITDVIVPTGLLEVVRTGKPQKSTEYVVGKRKYVTNRTPLIDNGKIVGAVGVFQEISEIEEVYKKLNTVQDLNNELTALINSSYDGIMVCSGNGKILRANKASLQFLSIEDQDIIGEQFFDLFQHNERIRDLFKHVKETKNSTTIVEWYKDVQLIITANAVLNEKGEVWRITLNIRNMEYLEEIKKTYAKEKSRPELQEVAQLSSPPKLIEGMIFESNTMREIVEMVKRIAKVESTVLIRGESGTGKELIAELVHQSSNRKDRPFIKINCGAIPENLLESELFGYAPGAFTGANRKGKEGLFELADKGTIFLDEIGEMPLSLQVKILRVLQEKEVQRIGEGIRRKIDVRIIAATNRNLEELVEQGKFREDLYFRLNVIPIHIPPLRERKDDILPLISYYTNKFREKYGIDKEFSVHAISVLLNHNWQGNVRELINIIERLVVTIKDPIITDTDVLRSLKQEEYGDDEPEITVKKITPLKKAVEEVERQLLEKAFAKYDSTYEMAKVLDVNQSTIVRKIKKLGIRKTI